MGYSTEIPGTVLATTTATTEIPGPVQVYTRAARPAHQTVDLRHSIQVHVHSIDIYIQVYSIPVCTMYIVHTAVQIALCILVLCSTTLYSYDVHVHRTHIYVHIRSLSPLTSHHTQAHKSLIFVTMR